MRLKTLFLTVSPSLFATGNMLILYASQRIVLPSMSMFLNPYAPATDMPELANNVVIVVMWLLMIFRSWIWVSSDVICIPE